MARSVEWISGVAAGLVAVSWLGWRVLHGITGVRTTVNPADGSSISEISAFRFGIPGLLASALLMLTACGVAVGAERHGRRRNRQGLLLLWLCTLLFILGSSLMIFSFGLGLAVAAGFAVIAAAAGTWAEVHDAHRSPSDVA
jgi:hypothetical protein